MENNANYALVGVLASAVIVALFAFVYWFAGPSSNMATKAYDVVFTGSVSGIGRGTDVLFNGIRVGQVSSVSLDPADTNRVVARIELDATAPVKADTKVMLGFQGLTGVGSVQLAGGSQAAGDPVPAPGETVPVLYAAASDFQSILDGLSATIGGAATAVDRLNGFLDANDSRLNATIENVETFTAALSANSEGVEDFLVAISAAGREIGPMASQISSLSEDLRALVEAVPPDQIAQVVADVAGFTGGLSRNAGQIDEFFATTSELATSLGTTVRNVETFSTTLAANADGVGEVLTTIAEAGKEVGPVLRQIGSLSTDLRGLVDAIKPEQVTKAVGDVTIFTDSLARNSGQIDEFFATTSVLASNLTELTQGLSASVAVIDQVAAEIDPAIIGRIMENVDSFSTQLGDNAANVDTIVANVTTLSASLVGSAERVDTILTQIDEVVSSAGGEGMFAEIAAAAGSVRILADQLNISTAQIAAGLNNFASGGLSQYSALAAEARTTLQRLDRVVRNLENNPQGLIFGGETVRDYNKR